MRGQVGRQDETQQYNGITQGVIWQQLLLFFFPLLFGTFFQMLYNTTDAVIVGRFVGTVALSAIGGAASQIVNVIVGAFLGLASGASVVIAQYFGARDDEKVSASVHTSIAMSVLFGAVFMVAGILLADPMLKGMNTPADSFADSRIYLQIYFAGMVPNLIYNMGVFGAALATILCQLLSAILVMQCLMKSRESYGVRLRELRINRRQMTRILQIGIPAMVQSLSYSITNVILQAAVNGFGTDYVAAWAACGKADQVFWMTSNSFGVAVTTFIGQNYGAGKMKRVRRCIRESLIIDTMITVSLSLLLWFMADILIGLFTTDQTVIRLGRMMMHFFVPCYVTFIAIEIFSDVLRGLGDSFAPMVICVSGICVLRVLWVLIATRVWPQFSTLMWSYPVSWVPTGILLVLYFCLTWGRNGKLTDARSSL